MHEDSLLRLKCTGFFIIYYGGIYLDRKEYYTANGRALVWSPSILVLVKPSMLDGSGTTVEPLEIANPRIGSYAESWLFI